MRRAPFGLLLVGLLAASSAAGGEVAPAPGLVRLDQKLSAEQAAKERGEISPESYAEFVAGFRGELESASAVAAPSSANAALRARILARLGESRRDFPNLVQRLAMGQARFNEKNYPAALAEAEAVLARDPSNKEALALKHFSEGRVAMGGKTSDGGSAAPAPRPARRFHFVAADPTALPFKLAVRLPPATAPPELVARGAAPAEPGPGPLPLLPLAGAATLGLAAYGVSRSRGTYESAEGLDDDHPKPVGRYQRLVAGAILAGALGGVVYTLGAAAVSAAPVAIGYAAQLGSRGMRLAGAEVGAINPLSIEKAEEAVPEAEAAAADVQQIVIKKGEILNRVWHSDWKPDSTFSGPQGFSYCRGASLPIHAAHAIEGRGLNSGVVNNARMGGLYRVTTDVVVTIRRSIGGYDEEILFRNPEDLKKLETIPDSISIIPEGP